MDLLGSQPALLDFGVLIPQKAANNNSNIIINNDTEPVSNGKSDASPPVIAEGMPPAVDAAGAGISRSPHQQKEQNAPTAHSANEFNPQGLIFSEEEEELPPADVVEPGPLVPTAADAVETAAEPGGPAVSAGVSAGVSPVGQIASTPSTVGAFEEIAKFCDLETLRALLFVCKASFDAATSSTVWEPRISALAIPVSASQGSADPEWVLQGRLVSPFATFERAYRSLMPVIEEAASGGFSADAPPSDLLQRARLLANASRFAAVFPALVDPNQHAALATRVSQEESRLLEIIGASAGKKTSTGAPERPHPHIFTACEVYFNQDREHFREKVIATYFSYLLSPPTASNAFVLRAVSAQKLETEFGRTMAALVQVYDEISAEDSVLSPSWNKRIWTYVATRLIGELTIYLRKVLEEAAEISTETYLTAISAVSAAATILTENTVVNEIGDSFDFPFADRVFQEMIDPIFDEWSERQVAYVHEFAREKVLEWNKSLNQREDETEKFIWSSVPKKSDKSLFMSAFKWAFVGGAATTSERSPSTAVQQPKQPQPLLGSQMELQMDSQSHSQLDMGLDLPLQQSSQPGSADAAAAAIGSLDDKAPATAFEAQTAVLVSKLKGMESLVSIELVIEVINMCRTAIQRLRSANRADAKRCQTVFCTFLKVVGNRHIQPAFERALKVLNEYDPKKFGRLVVANNKNEVAVEPLVMFTELVNVGDIAQQMVHVFFEEELVSTKLIRKSDFAAPSVNAKRKFEQMLDDMLAAGLSRGIDVLIDQVEFTLVTEQLGSDYLPLPAAVGSGTNTSNGGGLGPTKATEDVISLVRSHLNLLKETTEKSLYDVFQHEVGVRLYSAISKHIKSQIISEDGAIVLISDVNAFYSFALSLRQRSLLPYYETLKQIAQLYLIDKKDAKQIGLAMSDSARYNNLVTTEDLVEFVKRRRDWPTIKHKVEKSLYGAFECIVC